LKAQNGRLHPIPDSNPLATFSNGKTTILVFERGHSVELFQKDEDTTQRLVITHKQFEQFQETLQLTGFAPVAQLVRASDS
jgi:hypothetical protein